MDRKRWEPAERGSNETRLYAIVVILLIVAFAPLAVGFLGNASGYVFGGQSQVGESIDVVEYVVGCGLVVALLFALPLRRIATAVANHRAFARAVTILLYGLWAVLALVAALLISYENSGRLSTDLRSTLNLDLIGSRLALGSIAPISIAIRLTALLGKTRASVDHGGE